jgi:hypothetical protein
MSSASALPEVNAAISGLVPSATYSGSPRPNDPERERRGNLRDEVALALLDHGIDQLRGPSLDVALEMCERLGGEAARHDAPQPPMAGVVHGDHRTEELAELLG